MMVVVEARSKNQQQNTKVSTGRHGTREGKVTLPREKQGKGLTSVSAVIGCRACTAAMIFSVSETVNSKFFQTVWN